MTHPTDPVAAMREAAARIARTAADDPLFDHENGFVRRIGSWIALRIDAISIPAAPPGPRDEALRLAREGLRAMIGEWDKLTRYGSPMARAANENLQVARYALAAIDALGREAPLKE